MGTAFRFDCNARPFGLTFYPGTVIVNGFLSARREIMTIRKRTDREYSAHLQGTLDLLILRTLVFGPQHGQGIARAIKSESDNVLIVDHGSLYPALQRLEDRGFIDAAWGTSENNRKARFYTLTRNGRKELVHEEGEWRRIASAIMRVLGPARE
jgi:PadR family transcriptional regulator, regulatory protein PadR